MPRFRPHGDGTRDVLIILRRLRGESYASIGRIVGLTAARVHQIVKDYGPASRPPPITPETPVGDLPGLTAREIRGAKRARVVTVGELAALDDETILSWPGCGQQSLNRVRKALALAGFEKKMLLIINVALLLCCACATALYDHGVTLFLEI